MRRRPSLYVESFVRCESLLVTVLKRTVTPTTPLARSGVRGVRKIRKASQFLEGLPLFASLWFGNATPDFHELESSDSGLHGSGLTFHATFKNTSTCTSVVDGLRHRSSAEGGLP